MTLREQFEQIEEKNLSQYASLSSKSKGRARYEEPCDIRTDFQRDRDRVVHSKAFRRLKHKTQVFLAPEGDHYRTRLTHTLEVSQIARTIARALFLNEDLTEAIALGHDLGHTPFGHTGENALNNLCPQGFHHNEQSLRVVNILERKGGLNLTQEVRDGILCHTGEKSPQTLEGKIVRFADRIAYINHDIDDAIRAGVLGEDDIPKEYSSVLGVGHSERINSLIRSIIFASSDKNDIIMEPSVNQAMMGLRSFMFESVYKNPYAKSEESKFYAVVEALYEKLTQNPRLIPESIRVLSCSEEPSVIARDYIAGMTDRYAVSLFEELFVPKSWNI
jgi:dGTPase